jgi:hypothetical protein
LSGAFGRQRHGLSKGFKQAAFVGGSRSGDIEGSAMIDRGPHHWQATVMFTPASMPRTLMGPWPWS